jgi:putative ABC transport system substrate-binding protein
MKKYAVPVATLILGIILGFVMTHGNPRQMTGVRIAILTPVSHPSLDESIRGFKSELAASGYTDSTVECATYNAQGEMSHLPALIDRILAKQPDLVFSLTTPATAQAAKRIPSAGIPLVFTAVTDPVGAGIVEGLNGSALPITGVSDKYPVAEQMQFLKAILPSVRSVAILRNPAEQNSKVLSEDSKHELEQLGIPSVLIDVPRESEVVAKVEGAIREHNCILVNGDNLLTANLGRIIKLCSMAKVPLFVGDPDSVRKGAVATVGPSYFSLGQQTGKQAIAIIKGKRAGTIPCEVPTAFDYVINTVAAEAMGVEVKREGLRLRAIWESRAGN